MSRRTAVRSISALKAMQKRCEDLSCVWWEIDGALERHFDDLRANLQELIDEIEEVYPRRGKGGAK